MGEPTQSYLKVPYDLRPAKQVERRMLVESLQQIATLGFPIRDYQYTGFGSVYFIDFVLFHKSLGISKMLSVEYDSAIEKRVKFNQPFRCVTIKLGPIADFIPTLSRKRRHLLWLDYDSVITESHLQDIWLAAAQLPTGSILLVTVDVEPPVKEGTPAKWKDYFSTEAGTYLGTNSARKHFVESNLIDINRHILFNVIKSGLASRDETFIPLYSFEYADGHRMLTVGGMIGTPLNRETLRASTLKDLKYMKFEEADRPFAINIPRLTRKERLFLDKNMPAHAKWALRDFELPAEMLQSYKDIYRYLPVYGELVF